MADEKFEADNSEFDEAGVQVEEAAEEVAAEAAKEPEAEQAVEVEAAPLDERVEAAVRNVAEEAAADSNAVAEPAPEEAPQKKRERRSKQARAAKAERTADDAYHAPQPVKVGGLAGLGVGAWVGISVACLALGCVLGRFVLGGASSAGASLSGATTVSESQLDDAFATYTYNGKTETITVRDVIEQTTTLDAAKDKEGNYALPSAEYAITVARNKILLAEVESRGITVSEDDAAAYAEETLGTSDFDAIASQYGMDAKMVKQLVEENCRVNALREEVVGTDLPEMPEAPEAAEEGKEDETTKAYAKYIIKLAGDEWDKDKDGWADAEGRYATALADYKVSKKGASYNAAQAAYHVAYQIYTEQQTEVSEKWTKFFNGLMSNAAIEVSTLVS